MKADTPTRRAVIATLAALVLAACGSRLPESDVIAQNAGVGGVTTAISGGGQEAGAFKLVPGAAGNETSKPVGANQEPGAAGQSIAGPQAPSTVGLQGGPGSSVASLGPATGSVVNIGHISTTSGVVGSIIGSAKTGAQIWATWVNAHGGLNGHRVNLITADDGGDPSTGLAAVKSMVEKDKIIALVAMTAPLSTDTIGKYLRQVKVPAIGGLAAEHEWFTNPFLFPQGPFSGTVLDGGVKVGIERGKTRVGIITCVEFALICSQNASVVEQDVAALGGQVVYKADVSLAQPDFTNQCLGAQRAGVDNFMLILEPNSLVRFVDDCATQSYRPKYSTYAGTFTSTLLQTPNATGLVTAAQQFPYPAVAPATADFRRAAMDATGAPPTAEFQAMAWVSGLILQVASANLPADNPTPADMLAGLYTIKNNTFGGLTAPLTFTPGQPTKPPTCYFLLEVAPGEVIAPSGLKQDCLPAAFGFRGG